MANLRYEKRLKDAQSHRLLEGDLSSSTSTLTSCLVGILSGDYGKSSSMHAAAVVRAKGSTHAADLFEIVAESCYHVPRSEARKIYASDSAGRRAFAKAVEPLIERFAPALASQSAWEAKHRHDSKGHYAKGRPWASIPSLKSGKKLY
jgi:hypothetical protein